MWSALCSTFGKIAAPLMRRCASGYGGGCPGVNLPWHNSMDKPVRFTIFYTIYGILGFGAPYLVVRHQLLRDATIPEPESIEEAEEFVDENEKK